MPACVFSQQISAHARRKNGSYSHFHERKRLGLDTGYPIHRTQSLKNLRLRRERRSLPVPEGAGIERDDNFEVETSTAHDAVHGDETGETLESIEICLEDLLALDERDLITVARPLAPDLACDLGS